MLDALATAPDLAAAAPARSRLVLDLALDPADAAALWRAAPLAAWREGRRVGTTRTSVVWHDTPDGALASEGVTLAEQRLGARTSWRLEARHPGPSLPWPPGIAPPILAEGASARAFPGERPVQPFGRLDGVVRWLHSPERLGLTAIRVLSGTLRAGNAVGGACRVMLEGAPGEVFATAQALAETLRLWVPRATLAAEAAGLAGAPSPPRHLGAPVLPPAATVDDALAIVLGQLADVLLHWAPAVGSEAGPEPVHQMRVALRRLRSALKLFDAAAGFPGLDAAKGDLQALARILGAARDWDVFLGGLGSSVAAAFPAERAIARMLAAAERQRQMRYSELVAALDGPEFRRLCLALAELAATRPWRAWSPADPAQAEARAAALDGSLADYARHALQRRLRHAARIGRGFAGRNADELHALRIHCKRLRYACELAAPAFSGRAARRFARRLAAVQEDLGHLNDGAVASALMRELGSGRGLASGLVRGFVAAREAEMRRRAERSWQRFRHATPFWE